MTVVGFATPVQTLLPKVEERMRSLSNGYSAEINIALDHLIDAGGKRVRPTVTLLVSSMLGVEEHRGVTLAAAVELLHTATLVHDDLIDGALLRRGNATLNAQWNLAATVLAGDFLFSQAAWLAAEVDSVDTMKMFAQTLSTIVDGEIGQAFALNSLTTREEYYERIYAKTASMFELAARAPAYLTSTDARVSNALFTFGHEIGLAFQVIDDVLDFSGDIETVGKPVAHDLQQGLLTLPSIYYLEENPDDEALGELLNGNTLEVVEAEALAMAIRQSGAVQRAIEDAEKLRGRARDALSALPASDERQALYDLTEYVVSRLH